MPGSPPSFGSDDEGPGSPRRGPRALAAAMVNDPNDETRDGPAYKPANIPPPSSLLVPLPRPSSVPPTEPATNWRFGRYDVLGRLAFGGMAEIYLARETADGAAKRYLVLKLVRPHVAEDPEFIELFSNEARLGMHLTHPNVCHVYDFGKLDEVHYLAMEWVNGATLAKLGRRATAQLGKMSVPVAVKIIAQMAEALDFVHRAKDDEGEALEVVHRDVTPHNIMVTWDGVVKLLDFGVAKARNQPSMTSAGVVRGKFAYMSPQQCVSAPLDGRSDIFSLGVCLYELLCGSRLYQHSTEFETMKAIVEGVVPDVRGVREDIPEALARIVQKALAKDPKERFAEASDMQEALERFLADSNEVVNAKRVAAVMTELFAEEIGTGPDLDTDTELMRRSGEHEIPAAAKVPMLELDFDSDGPAPAVVLSPPPPPWPRPKASERPWLLPLLIIVTLLSVGVAGWALGRSEPALETPTAAPIAEADPVPVPVPEVEVEVEVEAAPQPTPNITPAATTATLVIRTTPPGARVTVGDDLQEGTTPLTLTDLPAGPIAVTVRRSGHEAYRGEVTLVAGESVTLEETLREQAYGSLAINTRPWSKVYVGRRLIGTTPIARARVRAGSVHLRLVDRHGATHRKTVRVEADAHESVFYNLAN